MERTIWRGQSATLTIGQIQAATTANKHISKYVFHSAYTGLTGVGELAASSTTVHANTSVNSEKKYPITSYLLYKHNFVGTSTVATSNKVDNTLIVHEPLDATSLVKIEPKKTGNYHDWVWSNASTATFAITPTFASNKPWSKQGIIASDATTPTAAKGYTSTLNSDDISGRNEITWYKTTGSTTDLGKEYENITVYVKSIAASAPTPGRIEGKNATFVVRNAVTGLSGLADKTLYAGSDAKQVGVTITPSRPYSDALILVNENGQDTDGIIRSDGGAIIELDEQSIWFNAEEVTPGTPTQIIKFKVRSRQSNAAVDTKLITFTVNAVSNITKTIVEGETISVPAGIGTIETATRTSGNTVIRISPSGETLSITGLAVDNDTNWSITVTNAAGAHITISGKTTHLTDVSTSINTGDFIIVGTDFIGGLGATISSIVTQPSKGTASITSDGKLKYEASAENGPITAGTYAIKVQGANGATRTINITVSNITATLS